MQLQDQMKRDIRQLAGSCKNMSKAKVLSEIHEIASAYHVSVSAVAYRVRDCYLIQEGIKQ